MSVAPKNKKSRKKKTGGKSNAFEDPKKLNGSKNEDENSPGEEEGVPDDQAEGLKTEPHDAKSTHKRNRIVVVNGKGPSQGNALSSKQELQDKPLTSKTPSKNYSQQDVMNHKDEDKPEPDLSQDDTEARLEALARERATIKDELVQLRRFLDEIREKHEQEMGSIREQLEDTQREKEHAETQYRNLLGKVNTIKSQLGERLKADAVRILAL